MSPRTTPPGDQNAARRPLRGVASLRATLLKVGLCSLLGVASAACNLNPVPEDPGIKGSADTAPGIGATPATDPASGAIAQPPAGGLSPPENAGNVSGTPGPSPVTPGSVGGLPDANPTVVNDPTTATPTATPTATTPSPAATGLPVPTGPSDPVAAGAEPFVDAGIDGGDADVTTFDATHVDAATDGDAGLPAEAGAP
jgi:hypothetical protein